MDAGISACYDSLLLMVGSFGSLKKVPSVSAAAVDGSRRELSESDPEACIHTPQVRQRFFFHSRLDQDKSYSLQTQIPPRHAQCRAML